MKKRLLSLLVSTMLGAALLTGCGGSSSSASNGELNVFVWTEYVSDSAFQAFEKETGIKVNDIIKIKTENFFEICNILFVIYIRFIII